MEIAHRFWNYTIGGFMYARRLALRLKPNAKAEFIKTIETQMIPLLRKQQGFQDELARSHILPGARAKLSQGRRRDATGEDLRGVRFDPSEHNQQCDEINVEFSTSRPQQQDKRIVGRPHSRHFHFGPISSTLAIDADLMRQDSFTSHNGTEPRSIPNLQDF